MDPDAEIETELIPFIRFYKSGRVERLLGSPIVPPSVDPSTGVTSKDVTINPATPLSARLYLPSNTTFTKPLPLLLYIHGGGFMIESAFSSNYHSYLNSLVSRAAIVAVSVEYRLAPEHRLPAAYDDAWAALNWAISGGDTWLAEHADLSRVFLAGDSAGANIAHNTLIRAGAEGLKPGVRIEGMILFHPCFWGKEPVLSETTDPKIRKKMENEWAFVCPDSDSVDDPRMNPVAEKAPSLKGLPCEKVLVTVAEMDYLKERGRAYYEALKASGWGGTAELIETEGEEHVFYLRNPTCQKAQEKMERVVAFFTAGN